MNQIEYLQNKILHRKFKTVSPLSNAKEKAPTFKTNRKQLYIHDLVHPTPHLKKCGFNLVL